MMKVALAAVLALVLCSNQASADIVSMVCSGSLRRYEPSIQDITIAAQASSLDISNRQIVTPLGTFPITQVADTSIMFGTRSQRGTLDRLTGTMELFTRVEGDKTDMQTTFPAKVQTYAQLNCSVAKRLF